jgi:prolyl-tRNA editing enzyme YbaK/EbsC (Cys-tRNA(Pro) deacylase)
MPVLTPFDLQNFMRSRAIPGEIIYMDVPTPTVEAAAQALGVKPEQIVKSILFLVNNRPTLAITNGTALIDKRAIADVYGVNRKRVKLAYPEEMLIIAGYEAGAMPPFGHLQPIPTLMDSQVLNLPEVYAGGGAENAMLRLNPVEILRVSQARVLSLASPQA